MCLAITAYLLQLYCIFFGGGGEEEQKEAFVLGTWLSRNHHLSSTFTDAIFFFSPLLIGR